MNQELKEFIKENIKLIDDNTKESWEEIYDKEFPIYFTDTLLECGINPLKQGLDYIPEYFLFMSNIKEFTIPDNIEIIGNYAFVNCSSLTNIEIPSSVTDICQGAFEGCASLVSVTISSNVAFIDAYAFYNCKKLTTITYLGTKKEAIQLGIGHKSSETWREGSAIEKIICSDGVIDL